MRKLKIGYDASVTLAPNGSGVARYALELLRGLVELGAPDLEFTVLLASWRHKPDSRHDFLFHSPNVRVVRRRIPGPLLLRGWQKIGFPAWETLAGDCDVYHAPASYVAPSRAPAVVTVHDLGFLRDGREDALAGAYFRQTFPRTLAAAAAIITPSRFVAADVARVYTIPPARISPVHSGVNHDVFRDGPDDATALPAIARERGRFVLAVTSGAPRKRIDLVHALLGRGLPIIAVGAPAESTANPAFLPAVSDRELACLYRAASATVLTTREEGFGFPLLESLACGTPVICGRHSSLAEIGGDFPEYVEEETIEGFARVIERRLASPAPDAAWRRAAMDHAGVYTWSRAAAAVADVYRRVAAGG